MKRKSDVNISNSQKLKEKKKSITEYRITYQNIRCPHS